MTPRAREEIEKFNARRLELCAALNTMARAGYFEDCQNRWEVADRAVTVTGERMARRIRLSWQGELRYFCPRGGDWHESVWDLHRQGRRK